MQDLGYVFRRCVEASDDAVMLTDIEGHIFFVNEAWERLYGYPRDEAMGKTPRLLRSGHHDQAFYGQIWQSILEPAKGHWKGEMINRARDGREVTVLVTISPFRDEKETVKGYLSFAVDITEKKLLEAQLARQDRLASVGLMASGLAHEIGTPLGVIRGRAELLSRRREDAEARQTSLGIIIAQIDRITKIIYALLNLSSLSRAETSLPVAAAMVVGKVGVLTDAEMRRHAISFLNEVPVDARVKAEADRLQQVFLNLVVNSTHAIETALGEGRTGPHRIAVRAHREGDSWLFLIEDSGCGISSENRGHLFKPFFTTKEVGSGTGLGLAVTHQIVQSWGGTIWAESGADQGTVFKVKLPAA